MSYHVSKRAPDREARAAAYAHEAVTRLSHALAARRESPTQVEYIQLFTDELASAFRVGYAAGEEAGARDVEHRHGGRRGK